MMRSLSIVFRIPAAALLLCFVASAAIRAAELPWRDGDTVVALGDSITQDGRYVALLEAYLWMAYPDRDIDVFATGLSSETVSGITEPVHPFPRPNVNDRVERVLEGLDPDWAIVCYGMNDGIYHPIDDAIRRRFRTGLRELLDKLDAADVRVVLCTPPTFDAEAPKIQAALAAADEDEPFGYRKPYRQYNHSLAELGEITKAFADHPAVAHVVDLHAHTRQYVAAAHAAQPDYTYGDGVHPPLDGHLEMAVGILSGLGEAPGRVRERLANALGVLPATADRQPQTPSADAAQRREATLARFRSLTGAIRQALIRQPATIDAAMLASQIASAQQRREEVKSDIVQAVTPKESLR